MSDETIVSAWVNWAARLSETMTVVIAGRANRDGLAAISANLFRSIIIHPTKAFPRTDKKQFLCEDQDFSANRITGFSQPFLNFFLVLIIDEPEHEQHDPERHEAKDAVQSFELPHVKNHHSAKSAGQHGESQPPVNSLAQHNSRSEQA